MCLDPISGHTETLLGYVRDEFNFVSFGNNDGSHNWAGDWIEADSDFGGGLGPVAGNVRVEGNELRISDDSSAKRAFDFSGLSPDRVEWSVTIREEERLGSGDIVHFEVSHNGVDWVRLDFIANDFGASSRLFDITPYVSPLTAIRIRVEGYDGADGEGFFADDVEVAAYGEPDPEICGNGTWDIGEACDDGNTVGGDGCSATCALEVCGNGLQDVGEECDDGNTMDGDGCSSSCTLEICGNGIQDVDEECDDGNTVDGDGCSSNCTLPLTTLEQSALDKAVKAQAKADKTQAKACQTILGEIDSLTSGGISVPLELQMLFNDMDVLRFNLTV